MLDRLRDVVDALRRDVEPRRVAQIAICTVSGAFGLLVLYLLYRLDLLLYAVTGAFLTGIGCYIWRRLRPASDNEEEDAVTSDDDDADATAELEPVQLEADDEPDGPDIEMGLPDVTHYTSRPDLKRYYFETDDQGQRIFVINTIERLRRRKEGSRRKETVWTVKTFKLIKDERGLVDEKVTLKSNYKPIYGENKLMVSDRLHWMKNGPEQVAALFIGAVATLAFFIFAWSLDGIYLLSAFVAWLLALLISGIAWWFAWMPWAYLYLTVSNTRVSLTFDPPFGLPGSSKSIFISDILNPDAQDQPILDPDKLPRGLRWLARVLPSFGNLLEKWGRTGYKKIIGGSAGQGDEWIEEEGISHVKHGETVKQIIENLHAEIDLIGTARHDEDMDLQKQQLEVLLRMDGKLGDRAP